MPERRTGWKPARRSPTPALSLRRGKRLRPKTANIWIDAPADTAGGLI